MSIDIDLVINTGKNERIVVTVGNYTHNCQPMWTLALSETGSDLRLCEFDGMSAAEAVQHLALAVAYMEAPNNRAQFIALNPANGWGDYEGAYRYLREFYEACKDNPLCTVRTDC